MVTRGLLVVALVACGGHSNGPRDAGPSDAAADGIVDAGCGPLITVDAAPASTAPACLNGTIPGSCIDVSLCYGSRESVAGQCTGPLNIECCSPRFADATECDPDTVPQPNACLVEQPGDIGCPAGMARVDTFCVDRFEAALVELVGGSEQPWSPYFDPTGHTVRAVSMRGAVPQAYVSQPDAGAACAASNKRLCTDTEWLRACQGPTMTTYPYGNTREPGVCNDARAEHPAIELYGTGSAWIYSHLDSPCLNQEADGLDPA